MKLETPGKYPNREKIITDFVSQLKSLRTRWDNKYIMGKMGWQEATINLSNEIWTEIIKKNKKLIYISEVI